MPNHDKMPELLSCFKHISEAADDQNVLKITARPSIV